MNQLNPESVRLNRLPGLAPVSVTSPRRYTIVCSPANGKVQLSIGPEYDRRLLDTWSNQLSQFALVANWHYRQEGWALHVHGHVSGGVVWGTASWRDRHLRRCLPLALQAIRIADSQLFQALPQLDNAPVLVQFHASQSRYHRLERWGNLSDYSQPQPLTPTAAVPLALAVEAA